MTQASAKEDVDRSVQRTVPHQLFCNRILILSIADVGSKACGRCIGDFSRDDHPRQIPLPFRSLKDRPTRTFKRIDSNGTVVRFYPAGKSGCPRCRIRDIPVYQSTSNAITMNLWGRDHRSEFVMSQRGTDRAGVEPRTPSPGYTA
jgi:hypothetical protein